MAKLYIVIIRVVIVEKRERDQYILIGVCNTLDIKDSLSLLSLIWAILDKKLSRQ